MAIVDPNTPDEIWYPIPSLPGYQLSSDMRVRKYWESKRKRNRKKFPPRWKYLTIRRSTHGYEYFKHCTFYASAHIFLHRVIAELAYGLLGQDEKVRHYDDDKRNNYPSNLCPGSQKDNLADAIRNGKLKLGIERSHTRFTEDVIREVRRRAESGLETQADIGRDYGMGQNYVSQIKRRIRWPHVE